MTIPTISTSSINAKNLSRRELLRLGGIGAISAGMLAACGKQAGVIDDKAIASLGTVPPTTALAEAEVNDVVLLRTAASLEYNAIDTYKWALDQGLLTGDFAKAAEAAKRFGDDHQAHADDINKLIVSLGGKSHACANERVDRLYIQPAIKLITTDGNPDSAKDAATLAHAFETLLAQTHQGLMPVVLSPAIRAVMIRIGGYSARRAVVLAQILNPGLGAVGPTLDAKTGSPNIASVPSAFGGLANIKVSFGPANSEGAKTPLTMETPSLNGLVYEFVAC